MEAKPVMISDLGTIQQAGLQKKRSGGQASFLAMIEEAAGSVTDSREAKRYEKPERLYQGSETVGKRNKKSSRNHSLSSIDEGDTGEAGSLDLAGNEARSDRIANRSTTNQSEKPVRLTEGPITGSKSAAERKPSPDVKSTHSEHLMKTADGQDQAAAIESVLKSSDVQEGQASKSIKSIQQPAADHHEASNLGEKSQSKQLDGSSPAGTASNKYSSANGRSQLMDGTDMKAYFGGKSRFPKTGEAGSGPDELSAAEQSIGGQPMDTLRRRIGARTALSNGANASSVQAEQLQQLAASGKTASNTDGLERIAPFSPDSLAPRSLAERDASGSQIQADTSFAVKRNNDKQPMDMGRHGARRNREQTAFGDGANVSSAQAERQNKTLKRPTVQTAEDDQTAGEWRANKPPLLDESNTGAVLSKHQTIHDVFTKEAIKPAVHLSAHDQSQLKDNETLKSQNNSPNGTNRQSRNARLTAGLRSETMPAKTAFAETSARLTAAAASASGSKVLQPYVQPQERALQAEQSGEMRLQRVERAAGKVTGGIQVKGEKDSENDIKAALQDVQNGSTHFPEQEKMAASGSSYSVSEKSFLPGKMYRAGSEPHAAAAPLQTAVKESGQMKQDAPIQSSAVQHQAQQQVELQAASGQFEAGQRTAAHVKISAMEKADTAQLIRPKDGNSDKSASPEIAGPAHQEEQTANKTGTLHPYYGRTVGKLQQWLIYQSQSASGERETPVHEQVAGKMEQWLSNSRFSMNENGDGQLTMTLHPDKLGQLKIVVSQNENGIVARLTAETQTAKDLLNGSLHELKQQLADHGIPLQHIEVQKQSAPADSGRSQSFDQPQQSFQDNGESREQEQRGQKRPVLPADNSEDKNFVQWLIEGGIENE